MYELRISRMILEPVLIQRNFFLEFAERFQNSITRFDNKRRFVVVYKEDFTKKVYYAFKSQMNAFSKKPEEIKFFSFEDEYNDPMISDLPSTTVTH